MFTKNPTTLCFNISPYSLTHHQFEVQFIIESPDPKGQRLELPNWIPGSYMIRDFAKHIIVFEAKGTSGTLTYQRPTKSSWLIEPTEGPIHIRYLVFAKDTSIRSAFLDNRYGFFNTTSLCFEVIDTKEYLYQIKLEAPSTAPHWSAATGLQPLDVSKQGFGLYQAVEYQALIDYPFVLGELTQADFKVKGIPHALILVGKHYADLKRLVEDLTKICTAQIDFWQTEPLFDRYCFLTLVTADGFGGLEHTNSTALMCSREALEFGLDTTPSEAYVEFLSLCSHEYFHNWNIKRLKPKVFIPYSLQQEVYTDQLWFYEGITSYYDDYFVYRAGCINADTYLKRLAKTLTRGTTGLGVQRQTLLESSTLAWTTFYQQSENAINAISSYYAKGAVVALCLDLMLQKETHHQHSLDTVLRNIWQTVGQAGTTTEMLIQLCNPTQSPHIESYLIQALESTEALPWEALLKAHQVHVQYQARTEPALSNPLTQLELGAVVREIADGLSIQQVLEGSIAAKAGLTSGDILVALDYLKANLHNLKLSAQRFKAGDRCSIHYFRDAQLHETELVWENSMADQIRLELAKNVKEIPWFHTAS